IRYPMSKIAGLSVYVALNVALVGDTGQPLVLRGRVAPVIVKVPPSLYVPVTGTAAVGAMVIVQPAADELESTRPALGMVNTILSPAAFGSARPSSLLASFSATDHVPLT